MRKIKILFVLLLVILPVTMTAAQEDDCIVNGYELCERATSHEERVRELASVYHNHGFGNWLAEAGYDFDDIQKDARQPEEVVFTSEDGNDNDIVVAGYQVQASNLSFSWPAGFTTDGEVENGDCYQPDDQNPSKVCTNVTDFSGDATLWVSVLEWGQLDPETESEEAEDDTDASNCLTMADLDELGEIVRELEDSGDPAGAQIILDTNWVAPLGWVIHRSGTVSEFAREGETISVWSHEDCRPLAR
jgi:hypothetical protein